MTKTSKLIVVALIALVALFAANAHRASAHTYEHGRTVWFGDHTIGSDDVVNGDLNIVFGNAYCETGAEIGGDVRIYGGHFYHYDGCEVRGDILELGPGQLATLLPWPDFDEGDRAIVEQNSHVFRQMAWAVVVLFAFLLFPVRVRVALERVERHPGLSAATGTLAILAVVPLAILLLLSIIGIPLIVVEIAALLAGVWIGQAAVAILIGRRLFELLRPDATPTPLGALVLGLIVIVAASLLPGALGWSVTALVWLVGLGAAILAFVRETQFVGSTPSAPPPASGAPVRPAQ